MMMMAIHIIPMKYQDFSSDKKLSIQWRHNNFYVSQVKIDQGFQLTTSVSVNETLSSQHCMCLPFSFTNHSPWKTRWNFQVNYLILTNIFDDKKNKGTDGRFVPMTEGKVDNFIEMEEKCQQKRMKISPRNRCPGISLMSTKKKKKNMTCLLVDTDFMLCQWWCQ